MPFDIKASRPPKKELAEVRGNQVVYAKPLSGEDQAVVAIEGFSGEAKDSEIIIETPPSHLSHWLHVDLPHRVSELGYPLTTVAATA